MNNQRATKKITIDGIEFEINEWITGREAEYIDEPIIEGAAMKMVIADGQPVPSLDNFKNTAVTEMIHRSIKSVVISVDGKKDDILNDVLDLKRDIYDKVVKIVDDIVKKK